MQHFTKGLLLGFIVFKGDIINVLGPDITEIPWQKW